MEHTPTPLAPVRVRPIAVLALARNGKSVVGSAPLSDVRDPGEGRMPQEVLQAPLVLEYPFTRTTGPVLGGSSPGCERAWCSA